MAARGSATWFSCLPSSCSRRSRASSPVCDPDDFGAKRDGKTKDTRALQAAIDACAGKGGTVHLHDGTYLSGTLRLKSDLVLHIDMPAYGFFVRHADTVTFTNSTPLVVGTDARQGVVQRDVTGLVAN